MSKPCDVCGHDSDRSCHAHRVEVFECGQCGGQFCKNCLREQAVEYGVFSETDAAQVDGADLFQYCDECGAYLCPACFAGSEQ